MIAAAAAASSLKISELRSGLKITASALSLGNQLYVALSDGRLLLYQLPVKTEIVSEGSRPPSSAHSDKFDPTKIEEEEATLLNSFQLTSPATQICLLEYLNYVVLLMNKAVEIYSLTVQHDVRLVDRFDEFKFHLVTTWSDIDPNKSAEDIDKIGEVDLNEEDSEYDNGEDDSISLATVQFTRTPTNAAERRFIETRSNCHYLCMSSKRCIVILRWRYRDFDQKFEYKIQDKPSTLVFLNSDTILLSFSSGGLVKMSVATGKTTPIEIQFLNGSTAPLARSSFFFGGGADSLVEAFKAVHDKQLVILKEDNLVKLNSDLEPITRRRSSHSIDFKNPMPVPPVSAATAGGSSHRKLKKLVYWFPYIVAVYGNALELRDLEDYTLVQRLDISDPKHLGSSIEVQFNSKNLLLVTHYGIYKFLKTEYNYQLKQFQEQKEYQQAINLLEKLNPLLIDEGDTDSRFAHSHSPKQLKFMKLRQLQMQMALQMLNEMKFEQAIHIFIEFMAPPKFVLDNLPVEVKVILDNTAIDDYTRTIVRKMPSHQSLSTGGSLPGSPTKSQSAKDREIKEQNMSMINELVTYLTDARRKLTRLLDPDHPKFEWRGYTISLSLYEELQSDPDFSPKNSLRLVDNCLFKCYIMTNTRIIGPFLRIPNYCDFDLIERETLNMHMYSELIDFYYTREAHEKALQLLDKLCFSNGPASDDINSSLSMLFNAEYMVRYLQKLDNDYIDLILKYSEKLIKLDTGYFQIIFMEKSPQSEGLSRSKVLNYTRQNHWIDLETSYLEYIIFDMNDTEDDFINTLLSLYMDEDINKTYSQILRLYKLGTYNANQALRKLNSLPEADDETTKLILQLKINPLHCLSRDQEAVEIYLNDLNDNHGAVSYCIEVRKEDPDKGTNLVYYLLELYLRSGDTRSMMQILDDSRLDFLDPVVVTQRLPDDLPLKFVTPFLELNLRNMNAEVSSTEAEGELFKVKLISLKDSKLQLQKQYSRLTSKSRCPVCHKPFASGSILSVTPSGIAMHYGCSMNIG